MYPKDINVSIKKTYRYLRFWLLALALVFPAALVIGGLLNKGNPLLVQESLSAYYHASATSEAAGAGVMRDTFVGALCALGVILLVYQGVSRREDWALNLAGMFAIGVALFPTHWNGSNALEGKLHVAFAIGLFLCIGYVAIWCSGDTLPLITDEKRRKNYRACYRITGWTMVLLPALILLFFFKTKFPVIALECAGIAAFAAFWGLKNRELRHSDFESRAAKMQIKNTPEGIR